MLTIPVLGRQRQADLWDSLANLSSLFVSFRPLFKNKTTAAASGATTNQMNKASWWETGEMA